MTQISLVIGIALFAFIAAFCVLYLFLGGRPNVEKRIRRQYEESKPKDFQLLNLVKRLIRFIPTEKMVRSELEDPDRGRRIDQEMSRQKRRLTQAGFRRRDAAVLFMGSKLVMFLVLLILSSFAGYLQKQPVLAFLFSLLFGLMIPDLWLKQKIAARKERIQLALPDALDLMVMCVEAGLSLDQTLARIAPELRGDYSDLSDEFQLYSRDVAAGIKRDDALRSLGQRSDTDDLKGLTSALMQANWFGVAIAQSLRVYADGIRVKRRQRLEERAAKMSIKMLFPLVFCIFPAIFIVLIGPAVKQIIDTLVKR